MKTDPTDTHIILGTTSDGETTVKMPALKPNETFTEDSVAAVFECGDVDLVAEFLADLQAQGVKTRPAADVLADWNIARGRSAIEKARGEE
jgi:hypothetical protein